MPWRASNELDEFNSPIGKPDRNRYPDLGLATTGLYRLTGLPLVGAQILVVLLARPSSDKTCL